jgi:hypothetical protein
MLTALDDQAVRASRIGSEHLLCLSDEEIDLLVDLCHAGAYSDCIEASGSRRKQIDRLLWQMQRSLLPRVQELYEGEGRERLALK